MFDFRLKVFHTVAKRMSFTKAANELYITQPAVTRHIHEIESHFKVNLFERNGSRIKLTEAGRILLRYTESIFETYRNLEIELSQLSKVHSGTLRIGASTTIAQYILPPVLAAFHEQFKDVKLKLFVHNTEQIETMLQNNEIDLGLIEGHSKRNSIRYTPFLNDEIVLVARSQNPIAKKQVVSLEQLKTIPLLLREPGSGTLEVIAFALKKHNMKLSDLQMEMQLSSTESIKRYLAHSDCLAFLSVHSILQELKSNQFSIIDIRNCSITRSFFFIQPFGQEDEMVELFMRFNEFNNFML